MVTTNFLNTSEKIYNSKISIVYNIEDLQIGKTYLIINVKGRNSYNKPFAFTNEYKMAQIKSVTPKLDFDKILKTVTFDTIDNHGYGIYFTGDYTFPKYLSSSAFLCGLEDCFKKGWLYYDIEYVNLMTKNIEHAIVHHLKFYSVIYIENSKNQNTDFLEMSNDYFYMSDMFEYDRLKNKKIKTNAKLINNVNKLLQTKLSDHLIQNFKSSVAYTILNNTNKVPDENETLTIDGVTWYNGFYNSYKGVHGRNLMFYDSIPTGWRLPTLDEFCSMLKKHPLLKKYLADEDPKTYARRNNAGIECHYYSYFESNGFSQPYPLAVMTLDSNMYDDESMYFPKDIKAVDIRCSRIIEMSACMHRWNNGYRPYLLMLVKMSEDELKRQMEWARENTRA
ncbi:MAG: hypothetical protein [Wendovervirus sonii]|uniref:Fibrobacter succinogenes major paralogous domain-containing protein n=1 Tax=phage Lak_Megaphage_Sonny TaxID=3109229 RepID=A0ABZ0Z338_9CAUD|nr:MAG: hypothetical protein [phage Lak_Megaphage_Sonny]